MVSAVETNVVATGAQNEVRMILLGKTGRGKSAFGNTIVGPKIFQSRHSPDSVTTKCTSAVREFDGKKLFVVDTPGFLDTNMSEKELHEEITKSYQMTAMPGPHVFLLILDPTQRYTKEELEATKCLNQIFDSKAVDHTIVIFTHSDLLSQEETTIEQYLEELKQDHPINKLLDQVQRRYLAVNNYGAIEEKNGIVKALLDMITMMLANNNDQVYTSSQFEAVANIIKTEVSKGTYNPFNSDGSYALLPQTKAIVIEGYLRRKSDRRTN